MRRFALVFSALLAALVASPALAQTFPELTGRVVDQAGIIPPDVEEQLEAKLEALETQSQRQLVVATLPDLQGYDIADYGYRLGREWEIGDQVRNDGVLLIVAPNERRTRIEVGYGLEGILTDALSSVIIENAMIPRFRAGDFPGGINAGTDAIIQQLLLPDDEARQVAQQAGDQRVNDSGIPIGTIVWLVFVVFFFILPMFRGGKRRRYRRRGMGGAVGDIILWEAGKAIARGINGGGGGWGGGGFGGGGGFSGGGGSFGGGGASGGW